MRVNTPPPRKRRYHSTSVQELMGSALTPALKKRGFAQHRLIQDWPEIVGKTLAQFSVPERIRFPKGTHVDGTLLIRVAYGWGTEFQHLSTVILDKIAQYFGYRAISQIKCIQDPHFRLPETTPNQAGAPLSQASQSQLHATLSSIEEPELQAILQRLGTAIYAQKERLEKPSQDG